MFLLVWYSDPAAWGLRRLNRRPDGSLLIAHGDKSKHALVVPPDMSVQPTARLCLATADLGRWAAYRFPMPHFLPLEVTDA
jgi:hypothetical protein